MKHILRLDENDIIELVREKFKVKPDRIVSMYIDIQDEETDGIETAFIVEIEQNE